MHFEPGPFRSDAVNRENVGHRFARPEIEWTRPVHVRHDQPSQAQMKAFMAGTPRYEPMLVDVITGTVPKDEFPSDSDVHHGDDSVTPPSAPQDPLIIDERFLTTPPPLAFDPED